MKKITVLFKMVPNTLEKGYLMMKFQHPLHGTKYIGCYTRDTAVSREDAFRRFGNNCGQDSANFNFVEGEKS